MKEDMRAKIRALFVGLDAPGALIGAVRTVVEGQGEADRWRAMTPEHQARERDIWRGGQTSTERRPEKTKTRTPSDDTVTPSGARIVTLSDVKPERIAWLWDSRIPRGMITLIDGDPGVGKSTITLDIAARISTGAPMPLETERRAPADVTVIGVEDHLAATVRPRIDAAGGDPRRIHAIVAVPRTGDPDAPPTLGDVVHVERLVIDRSVALVVIDPIMAHLPPGTDAYRDADMRSVLTPWAQMAQRTGVAVLIVRHLRKGAGSAIYRGGGSIGIVGAARSALLVARDPESPEAFVLAHAKGNLAPPAPSLRYRIVDRDAVGTIEWCGVADGITADHLAAQPERQDREDMDLVEAAIGALADGLADGPRPTRDVEADVRAATGASPKTIERARRRLEIVATKRSGGIWYLALPAQHRQAEESGGVVTADEDNAVESPKDPGQHNTANAKAATRKGGVAREVL